MSESETPAPERRGIIRLLWGMVVRPRATLEYLNEYGKRAWWLPALLALILVILPILVTAPIKASQSREAFLATQEQMAERSGMQQDPAQMEQALSITANPLLTTVFPTVAGVLGRIVVWLAWAGALYLAGMALGGRSSYGALFRTAVWAWLPYTIRGLLQTVYILVSGQLIANPGLSGLVKQPQVSGETVGAIARSFGPPNLGQTLCAAGLAPIDLFLVWNLILLVIGVMVTTRLSKSKAMLVTLGVWVLFTVLGLLPTLVGSLAMRGLFM